MESVNKNEQQIVFGEEHLRAIHEAAVGTLGGAIPVEDGELFVRNKDVQAVMSAIANQLVVHMDTMLVTAWVTMLMGFVLGVKSCQNSAEDQEK